MPHHEATDAFSQECTRAVIKKKHGFIEEILHFIM